jgi:pyruvate/2-oxoacid:ferredoxin oxidoreductase beta subunit
MAGIYQPSIREVSLPNGRYVPAIDQGGHHKALPGCGRTPACKGCALVRAWALCIKEVGPKMQAVDLAWMAVQEHLWPLWRFHAIIGQYGGWCGEKMANLAAQGH